MTEMDKRTGWPRQPARQTYKQRQTWWERETTRHRHTQDDR